MVCAPETPQDEGQADQLDLPVALASPRHVGRPGTKTLKLFLLHQMGPKITAILNADRTSGPICVI